MSFVKALIPLSIFGSLFWNILCISFLQEIKNEWP